MNEYQTPKIILLGDANSVTEAQRIFSVSDGVEIAGTGGQEGGRLS